MPVRSPPVREIRRVSGCCGAGRGDDRKSGARRSAMTRDPGHVRDRRELNYRCRTTAAVLFDRLAIARTACRNALSHTPHAQHITQPSVRP